MTRRMNNGILELLDANGTVVGTRRATDQEIQEWENFVGTKPATDQDIREWGTEIQKRVEEWEKQLGDNSSFVVEKEKKL